MISDKVLQDYIDKTSREMINGEKNRFFCCSLSSEVSDSLVMSMDISGIFNVCVSGICFLLSSNA